MKKRTILPIAGLVVLSGIAAISGTFAWFQTDRTARITFSDATIRSTGSNLIVKYVGSDNTMDNPPADGSVIEMISGNASLDLEIAKVDGNGDPIDAQFVTDISGNGVDFYKPKWGHVINPNTDKIEGVSNHKAYEIENIGTADGHFIDFTLEVSMDPLSVGEAHEMQIHLGAGTGVFAKDDGKDADVAARKASRMSIIDETNVGGANILFVADEEPVKYNRTTGPVATHTDFDNTPLYIHLVEEVGEEAYGLDDYQLVEFAGDVVEEAFVDVPFYNAATAAADKVAEKGYLVTLTEAAPSAELNFRVWIEGTDSDAGEFYDAAIAGQITSVVELYALDVI